MSRICLCVSLAATPLVLAGTTLEFLPGASQLEVHVPKAGLMSFAGHEHLIAASDFTVVLELEDGSGKPLRLTMRVPVGGLAVMDFQLGEEDREKVRKEMVSGKVLAGEEHPEIQFTSTAIDASDADRWKVSGELVIRGIRIPVVLTPEIRRTAGGALRTSGTTELKLADFGIAPVSALGGLVRTGKTVEVRYDFISQQSALLPE